MDKLWALFGYDNTAFEIIQFFEDDERNTVAIVEGPPGSGKSTFASNIAASWRENGGNVVILEGDELNVQRNFYPYKKGVSTLDTKWAPISSLGNAVTKLIDITAGTSGAVTAVYEGGKKYKSGLNTRRGLFLDNDEREILACLEKWTSDTPLLLVADNIHWWDYSSLSLLQQLLSAESKEAYPFLRYLKILAVKTDKRSQPAIHGEYLDKLLKQSKAQTWKLRAVRQEEFSETLKLLAQSNGRKSTDTQALIEQVDLVNFLFLISSGHLAIAWKAAEYILDTPEKASMLAELNETGFLNEIFEERLNRYGIQGDQTVRILELASLIGLKFSSEELVCLSNEKTTTLNDLLILGKQAGIIDIQDDKGHFEHDYFRRYFIDRFGERSSPYYIRLEDCLRKFRPGEYLERYRCLILGGRIGSSVALLVLHAIQNVRKGKSWDSDLTLLESNDLQNCDLSAFLSRWQKAWSSLKSYNYSLCKHEIGRLPISVPKQLLAETDYLKASLLLATRSESDRQEAFELLEEWAEYWSQEAEIGTRLMLLRLYSQTHLSDKKEAQKSERNIIRILSSRIPFDPSAEPSIYKLRRSAASLYEVDIALHHVKEALDFFSPKPGTIIAPDLLEYYRCLVNYCAQLIANAKYMEAIQVHNKIKQLFDLYGTDRFPRPEYPLNNVLLAKYRCNLISAEQAKNVAFELINDLSPDADPYYLKNSLAVYSVLSSDNELAGSLFNEMRSLMEERLIEKFEPNMIYVIQSNYAGYLCINGHFNEAETLWESLYQIIEKIPYTSKSYFKKKHDLFLEKIKSKQSYDGKSWDEALVCSGETEIGDAWNNFGRGFRMPEVEFWREN